MQVMQVIDSQYLYSAIALFARGILRAFGTTSRLPVFGKEALAEYRL
jgi:hypothetical protein